MKAEDVEVIEQLISYYNHHTVEAILEKHPGFVVDDFTKLLALLERWLENE